MKKYLICLSIIAVGYIYFRSTIYKTQVPIESSETETEYQVFGDRQRQQLQTIPKPNSQATLGKESMSLLSNSGLLRKSFISYAGAVRGMNYNSEDLMAQHNLLIAALHWKQNPKRQLVEEFAEAILILGTQPEYSQSLDFKLKDKLFSELFIALWHSNPKSAKSLRISAPGTKLEQLISSVSIKNKNS